jgi:hypothetical protein
MGNFAAWLNLIRAAFNTGKIWFSDDPEYVEVRKQVRADWEEHVIKPFNEGLNRLPRNKPKQKLIRKPFRIALAILILAFIICVALSNVVNAPH